ncbi:EAL domain-containing protein [Glaciibacter psychrotolerans]|uniref:Diguanylate cyclase (GGDEF)-like protein n=1 Tax=Glaciibacter psychrotolerans TaxID=670054 RepID=A0A7Z0EF74_9MICO|nr:diguanylate cyclase (GGDEF)-like protein [Leifsonia psychrotolerans]
MKEIRGRSGASRIIFAVLALIVVVLVVNAVAALWVGDAAKWPVAAAAVFCAGTWERCLLRLGRSAHLGIVISLPVLVVPASSSSFSPLVAAGLVVLGVLMVGIIRRVRPLIALYSAALAGIGAAGIAVVSLALSLGGVPSHPALAVGCAAYVFFVIGAESLRERITMGTRSEQRQAVSVVRTVGLAVLVGALALLSDHWSAHGLPLMSGGSAGVNTLIVLLLLAGVALALTAHTRKVAMRRRLLGLIEGTLALGATDMRAPSTVGVRGVEAASARDAAMETSLLLRRSISDTIGVQSVRVAATPPRPGEIGVAVEFEPGRTEYVIARRDSMDVAFTEADRSALAALAQTASAVLMARRNIGGLTTRANSDPLTSLPNYGAFHETLTNINEHREYSEALAVLFIDVDDFKSVNDRHGHAVGDEMLREISRRLLGSVRSEDLVARVGGDEFAVILTHLTSVEEATARAERLKVATEPPLVIEGISFEPVLSIGLAYSAHREADISSLVHDADRSMLGTKTARRHLGAKKKSSIAVSPHHSSYLNDVVVRAIDDDRLDVAFQPIVSLVNNQIWAFEALVRYSDSDVGTVSPATLVEKAKSLGRLDALTRQVATRAMAAADAFRRVAPTVVCIAINIEAVQMLPERVGTFLEELAARYPDLSLCLELNERSVERVPMEVRIQAERMRERGILIALDDYGSQDSSVDALVRVPMDILKIDRGLVDDLDDVRQREVLTALQSFGDSLEYSMIVEGVENQRMADHLHAIGVRSAQGFHYGVPHNQQRTLARLEKHGAAAIVRRVTTSLVAQDSVSAGGGTAS